MKFGEKKKGRPRAILGIMLLLAVMLAACGTSAGRGDDTSTDDAFTEWSHAAGLTCREHLTAADVAHLSDVTAWMAQCRQAGRADIGLYALCFHATAGDQAVWQFLILRTNAHSAAHDVRVLNGEDGYVLRVEYVYPNAIDEDDLLYVSFVLPGTADMPELDLVQDDDSMGVLINYTNTEIFAS